MNIEQASPLKTSNTKTKVNATIDYVIGCLFLLFGIVLWYLLIKSNLENVKYLKSLPPGSVVIQDPSLVLVYGFLASFIIGCLLCLIGSRIYKIRLFGIVIIALGGIYILEGISNFVVLSFNPYTSENIILYALFSSIPGLLITAEGIYSLMANKKKSS